MELAFIDCETTGLNPEKHSLWELAVITGGSEYVWRIEPTTVELRNAEPQALEINGYYNRTAHPSWSWDDNTAREEILQVLAGRTLVASNPAFDIAFIQSTLVIEEPTWTHHPIDIQSVMVGAVAGSLDMSGSHLSTAALSQQCGVAVPEDRHTALGDARWVKTIWETVHGH